MLKIGFAPAGAFYAGKFWSARSEGIARLVELRGGTATRGLWLKAIDNVERHDGNVITYVLASDTVASSTPIASFSNLLISAEASESGLCKGARTAPPE